MNKPKRLSIHILALLAIVLLSACGGGGGGDDGNSNASPGSTWDQMIWDQDNWV